MTAAFNARAHTYAEYAFIQQDIASWLAEWIEPSRLTADLAALELGAGDGVFTRHLIDRFARVTAVDLAPRMVERGCQRFPTVRWNVADAWELQTVQAERLYSASLLQWCERPVEALQRWRCCVPPGGRTLHGFYVAPTLLEWQSLAPRCSPIVWRRPQAWRAFFEEAGWRVVRSESAVRNYRFPTALDLLRFFHLTGCTVARKMNAGAVRKILRELERRHAPAVDGGGVPTEWTFFRIEAVRD